jgi:hypothetical protein
MLCIGSRTAISCYEELSSRSIRPPKKVSLPVLKRLKNPYLEEAFVLNSSFLVSEILKNCSLFVALFFKII